MKKKWLFIIFFLMCAVFLPESRISASGLPHALMITRGDYDSPDNNLSPGPENDGKNFSRILKHAYGDSLEITSLEKEGAQTVSEVQSAIQNAFGESSEEDVNYFYFSGHGLSEGLCLSLREYMSASELAQAFVGISGTNFLVIDCCYSGNLLSARSIGENWADEFVNEFVAALGDIPRTCSALTEGGFHIITATAADELSYQDQIGENGEDMGFFTATLCAACGVDFTRVSKKDYSLGAAMADLDRDGSILFSELYDYTSENLQLSHCKAYPEHDAVQFVPVAAEDIPSTAVTDAYIEENDQGIPVLWVEYKAGSPGVFEGCLYRCQNEEELALSTLLTVSGEPGGFFYAQRFQTGLWMFSDKEERAGAQLPLGTENLSPGNYLLALRDQGGNTGSYTFMVSLGKAVSGEDGILGQTFMNIPDVYSIEEDKVLELTVETGESAYANFFGYPISCYITSGDEVLTHLEGRLEKKEREGGWIYAYTFVWDGKTDEGKLVVSGTYDVSVIVTTENGYGTINGQINVVSPAKKSIAGMRPLLSETVYMYDGMEKRPGVTLDGLTEGLDYTVTYVNNKHAGTASAILQGIGKYEGRIHVHFQIIPASLTSGNVKTAAKGGYTGKKQEPAVEVTVYGKKLVPNVDYTVSYSNTKKIGNGKILIRGMGDFSGKIERTYRIFPAKVKGLKVVKTASSGITLRWRRAFSGGGYEVQYSNSRTFRKNVKTITVKGLKNNRCVLSRLHTGRKYYFRVRCYKKVNRKKRYGAYSKIISS